MGAALGWDGRIASAKLFQTTVSPGVRSDVRVSGTSTADWGMEMTVRPAVKLSFVPFSLDLFERTFTPAERTRTFEVPVLHRWVRRFGIVRLMRMRIDILICDTICKSWSVRLADLMRFD